MTTHNMQNRPKSDAIFEKAKTLMPGGVNSPVRGFRSVGGGLPVVMKHAKGAYITDEDDLTYLDYVLSWGPAILGHTHSDVVKVVQSVAESGLSFGAPTALENVLAEKVMQRMPSIQRIRMVSSGTEAVMSAIRLARAYTGRHYLLKFEGCYHGHADSLLVKAGSGALTLGIPDSAGISPETAKSTLTANFNDLASVDALLDAYPNQIAAILVEPVAGNMGCIPPQAGFLEGLRERCTATGTLLIFDEVMTGFRVAKGGCQEHYGIHADITTLGKILGGGLPVGAYGGRREIMEVVAPLGAMYQAGTLSGNPLGMTAGIATLDLLDAPNTYEKLDAFAKTLINEASKLCEAHGVPVSATQVGAMFSLFFVEGGVTSFTDVCKTDKAFFNRFFWAMLEAGVYLAPSPFEASFTSTCHGEKELALTLNAIDYALKKAKVS